MPKNLEFGIQTNGIKHTHADPMPDIDTRFRMVKGTRLFDYVDKTPAANEVEQFLLASKKYHLSIRLALRFTIFNFFLTIFQGNL